MSRFFDNWTQLIGCNSLTMAPTLEGKFLSSLLYFRDHFAQRSDVNTEDMKLLSIVARRGANAMYDHASRDLMRITIYIRYERT